MATRWPRASGVPSGGSSPTCTVKKRCGGAIRGVPQGVHPEWLRLHTTKRRGGTSLGHSQASPAYATNGTRKNLKEFNAQSTAEPIGFDASAS